jgi:phage/plasmid-associated DNA primase
MSEVREFVEDMSDEESSEMPDVATPITVPRLRNKRRLHPAYQEYMKTNDNETHVNQISRVCFYIIFMLL